MNQTIRNYASLQSFVHRDEVRALQGPISRRAPRATIPASPGLARRLWGEIKGALFALAVLGLLAVVAVVVRLAAFDPQFRYVLEQTAQLLAKTLAF